MNIVNSIDSAARAYPDAIAISWIDRPIWTYRELMARAASLAAGLRARGLQPGDRITMAMSNSVTFYEVLLGAWIAGVAPSPQNCRLHPAEIGYTAGDSGSKICFATHDLAEELGEHMPAGCTLIDIESAEYAALHDHGALAITPRDPTDLAFLFYTSGTTGKPKGAMLTHRSLVSMMVSFLADSGAVTDDHLLHLAPMSHASGFLGLSYLARGRNNVVLPTGSFDTSVLKRALKAFAPLSFFAVPTIVRRLSHPTPLDRGNVEKIHRIFFGGAPMYVEDLRQALGIFGPDKLWHLYGQGESPNTITHLPPRLFGAAGSEGYEDRLASVGVPRSGVSVRVLREDDSEANTGEVGEIAVQGDTLMAGYWNKPEATAATLRNGWLHTGDLGYLNAQGYLTLVDRSKDMIISGGSNIYPREIEELLLTHEGVAECAVVGAPHPDWGEIPYAFIVPKGSPPDVAELDALIGANLARYKKPKDYCFVEDLPKSAYGKILKTELRKMLPALRGN